MTKKYQSLVAIVARNESKYIQECILHNHIIGFDKIAVVLHGTQDDDTKEKIEQIRHLVDVDVIEIDYHQPKWHQGVACEMVFEKYKDSVEWMASFDVDECLYDRHGRTINELLSNVKDDVRCKTVSLYQFCSEQNSSGTSHV